MVIIGFSATLIAIGSIAPVPCPTGPGSEFDKDRPAIYFDRPEKTGAISEQPVKLQPNSVLGEEIFAVPSRRYLLSGPVKARGVILASGGRLMIATNWQGEHWACIAKRHRVELQAGSKGPGVCIRDSDNDGESDRAMSWGVEYPIVPVRLAPVNHLDVDLATQVWLRLRVAQITPSSVTVERVSETATGRTVIYYGFSVAGQDTASRPWNQTFRLQDGKTVSVGGIQLKMTRENGDWFVAASGQFEQQLKLCNEGLRLWIAGATLTGN